MNPALLALLGARVAASSGYPITDSFNRADGAPGVTDTGQAWTVSGPVTISSNRLVFANTGSARVATPSVNMRAAVTFMTKLSYTQVGVRGDAFLLFLNVGGAIRVRANGVDNVPSDVIVAAGDRMEISVNEEAGGTRVRAYKNGTEIFTILDTRVGRDTTTQTAHLGAYANAATYDDFQVTAP